MIDRIRSFVDELDTLLRPAGFRRRRHNWNRTSGQFIDVVSLQISKSLTHVWVNLGVADELIRTGFRGDPDGCDQAAAVASAWCRKLTRSYSAGGR